MLSRGLLSLAVIVTKRSGGTGTTHKNFECCSVELGEFVVGLVGKGWVRADGIGGPRGRRYASSNSRSKCGGTTIKRRQGSEVAAAGELGHGRYHSATAF